VQFTDTSTGSPTSWSWDFDDGSAPSTGQNPQHTYTKAGTFTVKLTASNAGGSDTTTRTVTVAAPVPAPTASFTASPGSGTAPLAVQFTDTSTGSPTSWSWDFGDGSAPSTAQDPKHTFTTPGSYPVTLTVTNTSGHDEVTHTIDVVDGTAPQGTYTVSPTSAWTGWTRVVLTQQSLSDDSTPADQIRRVVDWGDGTAAVDWTTGTHLGHVYRTSGQHVPTVELTDLAGNSVVLTLSPVTVTDDDIAPTARLRVPAAQHRASSWRWLRGTAADAQTGVALVEVRAVEKRGHHWYAYRPAQHRWVRAADRAAALDRAGWARIRPAGRDWSSRLQGVRVGTLVVQLTARDHVGNTAPVRSHRFLLTRW
jgi:PKD repeat protein